MGCDWPFHWEFSLNAIRKVLLPVLLAGSVLSPLCCGGVIESGDFVGHIQALRDLTFNKDTGLYVIPSMAERDNLALAAATLMSGDIATAETQAAAVNYEVVQYTDSVSTNVYHGLREVNNTPTRGWGSYFVNLNATHEVLVEAPHPRFDTNSWDVAAQAFRDSDARGFLMAGAHRNANGVGTADVAHLANSIFQEVHKAWVGGAAERATYSIHGFDLDKHGTFPANTDAVLSSGDGMVSTFVTALDDQLDAAGFLSYAYNTLDVNDPANVAVNEAVVGSTFSSLGGTTNVQGVYSRSLGGDFVHVELEQSIRFDETNRIIAAGAIASAITAVPEPSSLMLLGPLMIAAWVRRKHTHRVCRTQFTD